MSVASPQPRAPPQLRHIPRRLATALLSIVLVWPESRTEQRNEPISDTWQQIGATTDGWLIMNLALFDFDGTITSRPLFSDFIHFAVAPPRLRLGKVTLAPLIAGYKLGLVPGSALRAGVVRIGFSRVPVEQVGEAGERFAQGIGDELLRDETMRRMRWHQEQGDEVTVVSGAFDVYLKHWCAAQGVGLICSRLEHQDGVLTGRYQGKQCVGAEKARRVRQHYAIDRYPKIYAYGDTREDMAMLALATDKFYRGMALA